MSDLTNVVSQEEDGLVREQLGSLDTIESDLADVRRRLDRLWHLVETSDDDMSENLARIKANIERQKRLEDSAVRASAILSQLRAVRVIWRPSWPERRAFAETFVSEIVVMPGKAVIRYSVPMPTLPTCQARSPRRFY